MPESVNNPDRDRSEVIRDVIGHVPGYLIRMGSLMILVLITMTVLISNFVHYPDVLNGEAVLSTQARPLEIVAEKTGTINRLAFQEGDTLRIGSRIADIESLSTTQGVAYSQDLLDASGRLLDSDQANWRFTLNDNNSALGDLEVSFHALYKTCQEYHDWFQSSDEAFGIDQIKTRIAEQQQLIGLTDEKIEFHEAQVKNGKEKLEVNRELYQKEVLSKLQFIEKEDEYFDLVQSLTDLKTTRTELKIALIELRVLQRKKEKELFLSRSKYRSNIEIARAKLSNALNKLEKIQVVNSPIEGVLAFKKPLQNNDFVKKDQPLFTVIPSSIDYIVIARLKNSGFGKVQLGQKARVVLANYPYAQYGALEGLIHKISPIPEGDKYRVEIKLTNGMKTTFGREIGYQAEMKGVSEIITQDYSLLQRLFLAVRGAGVRDVPKKDPAKTEKKTS